MTWAESKLQRVFGQHNDLQSIYSFGLKWTIQTAAYKFGSGLTQCRRATVGVLLQSVQNGLSAHRNDGIDDGRCHDTHIRYLPKSSSPKPSSHLRNSSLVAGSEALAAFLEFFNTSSST
jgi:hypothetical protein